MTFNELVALIVGFILIGEAIFLVYFLWRNYKEEFKKFDNNKGLNLTEEKKEINKELYKMNKKDKNEKNYEEAISYRKVLKYI